MSSSTGIKELSIGPRQGFKLQSPISVDTHAATDDAVVDDAGVAVDDSGVAVAAGVVAIVVAGGINAVAGGVDDVAIVVAGGVDAVAVVVAGSVDAVAVVVVAVDIKLQRTCFDLECSRASILIDNSICGNDNPNNKINSYQHRLYYYHFVIWTCWWQKRFLTVRKVSGGVSLQIVQQQHGPRKVAARKWKR